MSKLTRSASWSLALAAVAMMACAGPDSVLMDGSSRSVRTADAVGDRDDYTTHQPGVVRACALFGDEFGVGGTFEASAPSGEDVLGGTFEIRPRPFCIEIWNATHDGTVPVSASFVSVEAGWTLDFLLVATGNGESHTTYDRIPGVTSATVNVNSEIGGIIWFKFIPEDAPPGGGQGCTPGYWRQAHHYDSWTLPYTPSTLFGSVFSDAFPGKTLGQVVALGGGGVNALGRMSVAALLNAASEGVSFDLTTSQVIEGFNAAYAIGTKSAMNDQKDQYDFLNNQGCPLN